MACDCLKTVDQRMLDAGHNCAIARSYVFDGPKTGVYPTITTKLIEKKRGEKPLALIPTFCPFCGKRYADEPSAAVGSEEASDEG
ncbi:hypothetical protein ACTJI2_13570 [Pseudoxanthomonas sp. 22568]|uniref:hypothetical protein n=1 Tax=Pseudoxanthomonas sp. 22568 TaxID=3453945 RepID=UPI003F874A85